MREELRLKSQNYEIFEIWELKVKNYDLLSMIMK